MKKLSNIHPGEVLLEEFLKPMAISQNALARALEVPPRRVNEIVPGKRSITADTALRLAAFSERPRASGWACRPITAWNWTWNWQGAGLARHCCAWSRRGRSTGSRLRRSG